MFGQLDDGTPVELYRLTNRNGLSAQIMTYGGTLVSLRAPDQAGHLADVVLGFDQLAPYLASHPYFGSLIGRYGNRIARGQFQLDGVSYQLACNNGPNHLHGGERGFDKVLWQAQPQDQALALHYHSRNGAEGYPGGLDVQVLYTLSDADELQIDYRAVADQPTILNLTNHSYFNLAGGGTIHDHQVQIAATHYLPTDATNIPTGERRAVAGSPFDFSQLTRIGDQLSRDDEQLRFGNGGIDHTYILDTGTLAAQFYEPTSGRLLTVTTTQPGVQFYTGNFLDGSLTGRSGVYVKHSGLCLETQHFPDSPNQPEFPSSVLRPGEVYQHTTVYQLSVRA
ncbi:MAG: galactose mutarotase [Roseiflexaceae bacterium]|nr:galactose mutarotase [Roseiflexaceae bacterium]